MTICRQFLEQKGAAERLEIRVDAINYWVLMVIYVL